MPELFKHMSVTQMAALFCLSALALTWLGVFLFRRLIHSWIHGRRNANEMIGLTLAAFAALYGILLGLLAVEAYQDFSAVKEVVSNSILASRQPIHYTHKFRITVVLTIEIKQLLLFHWFLGHRIDCGKDPSVHGDQVRSENDLHWSLGNMRKGLFNLRRVTVRTHAIRCHVFIAFGIMKRQAG